MTGVLACPDCGKLIAGRFPMHTCGKIAVKSTHTLNLKKPQANNLGWDGDCSCAKWSMRNRSKTDIREAHNAHVQHELGAKEDQP